MKRIIVATAAAACAGLLMAAAPEKVRTPEEMEEHLMFTGGPLEKLDAVKGQIAVIDTQSMMTPTVSTAGPTRSPHRSVFSVALSVESFAAR